MFKAGDLVKICPDIPIIGNKIIRLETNHIWGRYNPTAKFPSGTLFINFKDPESDCGWNSYSITPGYNSIEKMRYVIQSKLISYEKILN